MKVLFVYPNVVRYPKDISIGIAYLSAVLKKNGHETALIDTTFGMKETEILSRVKEFKPNLIAISCVTNNFDYATHIATIIKKDNKIPIIVGGVHPTVDPEETLRRDCFDMVCIGEGDNAIVELVTSMEREDNNTSIRSIWFKENGRIIKNELEPLCVDLDTLPYPDLGIYDFPRYLRHHNMVASFMGTRGCPHQCTYCINRTYQQLYKGLGRFVRYRSIDNIISEVKTVVAKYNAELVSLYDDTFTLDEKRVKEFCKRFKNDVGLPFYINARVDTITEPMCQDLRDGGCIRVSIGLESGDPAIRKEVLKRDITDEQIIEGCKLIKKYGFELYTYNMIGIPGEKMCNIRKTIALNRKVKPHFLIASIFTAYKGTELYERCKNEGMLNGILSIDSYYTSSNVRHPYLSARKLNHIRKWFGFYVFIVYDIKRALIDLVDRYLIINRFYTSFRSIMARKFLHSSLLGQKEKTR